VHAAGEGQLEIMVNNGNIPNEVEPQDVGVYLISFVPTQPGTQQVDILFNGEALPGQFVLIGHLYSAHIHPVECLWLLAKCSGLCSAGRHPFQ
jgi:hypothetical protein